MAESPAAKRYAQALFELGIEHDQLEPLGDALNDAATLFADSAQLRNVLTNPAVELNERRDVIEALVDKAGWPRLFRNFMLLLIDRDRIRHIEAIADEYARRTDDHLGRARASVTSATELSDDQIESLQSRLGELVGKDVIMTTEVDESLIGGVVARVGGTIYDGSVRNHLQRMRDAILREV